MTSPIRSLAASAKTHSGLAALILLGLGIALVPFAGPVVLLAIALVPLLRWPRRAFAVLMALTPLAQVLTDFFPNSYYGAIRDVLLVIIALGALSNLLASGNLRMRRDGITLALLSFCLVVVMYIPLGPGLTQALLGAKALILYSLVFFMALYSFKTEADLRFLCWGMVVVSGILSGYALFSFAVPQSFFPRGGLPIFDGTTRLHYSSYTYYFAELLPLLWVWMTLIKDKGWRFLIGATSALEVALVLLSGLRAAWIGLAIAVVVFLGWRRQRALPALLAVGVAIVLLVLIDPQIVINRIGITGTSTDIGFTGRLDEFQATWLPLIQRHPLGLGTGTFSSSASLRWQPVLGPLTFEFTRNGVTHNGYLEILAELGPAGLFTYLGLIGAVLWRIKRNARTLRQPLLRGLNLVGLSQLLSYCAFGLLTPAPILFPVNVYFFLFAGLAIALPRMERIVANSSRPVSAQVVAAG